MLGNNNKESQVTETCSSKILICRYLVRCAFLRLTHVKDNICLEADKEDEEKKRFILTYQFPLLSLAVLNMQTDFFLIKDKKRSNWFIFWMDSFKWNTSLVSTRSDYWSFPRLKKRHRCMHALTNKCQERKTNTSKINLNFLRKRRQ